jgi:hypothetical protein
LYNGGAGAGANSGKITENEIRSENPEFFSKKIDFFNI